jgi:carboxylesterase type B
MMVGHNSHEGVLFDPRVSNEAAFEQNIRSMFPGIQDSVVSFILNDLYPPVYDGSQPYTTFLDRFIFYISEAFFLCGSNAMVNAAIQHATPAYSYQFSYGQVSTARIWHTPSTTDPRRVW